MKRLFDDSSLWKRIPLPVPFVWLITQWNFHWRIKTRKQKELVFKKFHRKLYDFVMKGRHY